ncbi:MAG: SPOR domain-containing protein [Thermodesulfobacteriota bacterium]
MKKFKLEGSSPGAPVRACLLLLGLGLFLFFCPRPGLAAEKAYGIKIGPYKDKSKASGKIKEFKKRGFEAFQQIETGPEVGRRYNIFVGRFETKNQAADQARRLKAQGVISAYRVAELPRRGTGTGLDREGKPARESERKATVKKSKRPGDTNVGGSGGAESKAPAAVGRWKGDGASTGQARPEKRPVKPQPRNMPDDDDGQYSEDMDYHESDEEMEAEAEAAAEAVAEQASAKRRVESYVAPFLKGGRDPHNYDREGAGRTTRDKEIESAGGVRVVTLWW